jgi:hypothetical protein
VGAQRQLAIETEFADREIGKKGAPDTDIVAGNITNLANWSPFYVR